jgi:flavodoxin
MLILLLFRLLDAKEPATALIIFYSLNGVTERVANQLSTKLGGAPLKKITVNRSYSGPVPYVTVPFLYLRNVLPGIVGELPDISPYNEIYIGSPVWAWSVPPPIRALLAQIDFSGKKVIPFFTYRGAQLFYDKTFKKLLRGENVTLVPAKRFAWPKDSDVKKWADEL